MTKPLLPWVFLFALMASGAYAADPQAPDTKAAAADPRLEMLHDVDHPWAFKPAFADRRAWEQRAKQVREQILIAEGLWPMPAKTPLNPVIHGKVERDGYTVEKVFFASMPGHYVSGSLYRPTGKTGKLPAVLTAHGHWAGGRFYENSQKNAEQQIKLGAEKTIEGAKYPLQARCAMLAQMGCVVFFYDMVGYADSTAINHREGFTDAEAALRLQSFMGLQSWNSIRALDFLTSLPDVDTSRIAMTGASGGGTQTMILSGIDDRLAVSFPAVMVSTAMQGGCICENSYYLRVRTNNTEFASLFAPKPLGMTSANDWTKELLTKGFPEIKSIYDLYGATNQVMAWYNAFEHNYNQVSREEMYNWMNDHLKLALASPVQEKPFVPLSQKELSVYDEQHPRPADSLSSADLRKKMTAASDAQLAELAKTPEEYRKTLKTALQIMLDLTVTPNQRLNQDVLDSPVAGKPWSVRTGHVQWARTGAKISYRMLIPKEWDGRITVWVDPSGIAILSGQNAQPAIQKLLDHHSAVLAADLLGAGQSGLQNPLGRGGKYAGYNFSGYYYGYNPTVLADRVNDLFAVLWATQSQESRPLSLLATGKAGPWALLAQAAIEGDHKLIDRAAIDLNHFDFDQVRDPADAMMLPGALKYGGLSAFASLCTSARTRLWNAPTSWNGRLPLATPTVSLENGDGQLNSMIDSLFQEK